MAASVVVVAGRFPVVLERELGLGWCSSRLDGWQLGLETEVREDPHDY